MRLTILAGLMVVGATILGGSPSAAYAQQRSGPVDAADRNFLASMHATALFAIPASDVAEKTARQAKVRTIGRTVGDQDRRLDRLTQQAAGTLKVALPTAAAPDQQAQLKQLKAGGAALDAAYVRSMRAADGTLLATAAAARAGTRNDTVRKLAEEATRVVAGQLPLLEGSGLVDFEALPRAPGQPSPSAGRRGGPVPIDAGIISGARTGQGSLPVSTAGSAAVLGLAIVVIVFVWWRYLAPSRRNPGRPR
ncbi:DUF4142 domain-containing protein [Actinoplanes sp. NPDC049548]|uniref:DUF4142 domain-containing protein n=1 Tax=Actinoplanes sp. NPDC049548 TaxID=3155152 RepID=UPI0034381723